MCIRTRRDAISILAISVLLPAFAFCLEREGGLWPTSMCRSQQCVLVNVTHWAFKRGVLYMQGRYGTLNQFVVKPRCAMASHLKVSLTVNLTAKEIWKKSIAALWGSWATCVLNSGASHGVSGVMWVRSNRRRTSWHAERFVVVEGRH